MTELFLSDTVRARINELERTAATLADKVMILRSEKEKLEHRLEEMTEARDELKARADKTESDRAELLEGLRRQATFLRTTLIPHSGLPRAPLELALNDAERRLSTVEARHG